MYGAAAVKPPPSSDHSDHPGGAGTHANASVATTTLALALAVCGASLLSLPVAANAGSLIPTVLLIAAATVAQVLSLRVNALATALYPSVSYSASMSTALFGPDLDGGGAATGHHLLPPDEVAPTDNHAQQMRRRTRRTVVARLMDVAVFAFMGGFGAVYIRAASDATPQILQNVGVAEGSFFLHRGVYIILCVVGLTPVVAMRSFKELAIGTAGGLLTIGVVVAAMVVAYGVSGGAGYSTTAERDAIRYWDIDTRFLLLPPVVLAAFGGANVVPQLYLELADHSPSKFFKASDSTSVVLGVVYSSAAIVGYLTFGTAVASPEADGSVLNNYPVTALWSAMRMMAVAHLILTAPIMMLNSRVGIATLYLRARGQSDDAASEQSFPVRLLQAFSWVGLLAAVAWLLPNISAAVGQLGAYLGVLFVLGFPGMLAMVIYGGTWEATQAAVATREPERYVAWPAGRALGAAGVVTSAVVTVVTFMVQVGAFGNVSLTQS